MAKKWLFLQWRVYRVGTQNKLKLLHPVENTTCVQDKNIVLEYY